MIIYVLFRYVICAALLHVGVLVLCMQSSGFSPVHGGGVSWLLLCSST
jgi:preprotein translocase subunit SecG